MDEKLEHRTQRIACISIVVDVALNMISDTYFVPDRFADFVKYVRCEAASEWLFVSLSQATGTGGFLPLSHQLFLLVLRTSRFTNEKQSNLRVSAVH